MLRLIPYLTLGLLVYVLLIYLDSYHHDDIMQYVVAHDKYAWLPVTRKENERRDAINRLEYDAYGKTIGTLEKDVLIAHTVFIGATVQMVELALSESTPLVFSKATKMYYVYFLPGDKRPTVFEFVCTRSDAPSCDPTQERNKQNFGLSKAYKKSTIDLGNLDEDSPEPGTGR